MIEEEHIRFVAAADVTDDCRVEVQLRKARQTLTPSQAVALSVELARAALEASEAAEELLGERPQTRFDVAILSPDCGAGNKHRACIGTAWDMGKDQLTNCTCDCHGEETAA